MLRHGTASAGSGGRRLALSRSMGYARRTRDDGMTDLVTPRLQRRC